MADLAIGQTWRWPAKADPPHIVERTIIGFAPDGGCEAEAVKVRYPRTARGYGFVAYEPLRMFRDSTLVEGSDG